MILAVDVDYQDNIARVAGVGFATWSDSEAQEVYLTQVDGVSEYMPGMFYKRELPCILKLLEEHHLQPQCIVVDGYVFLDGEHKAGLGKHLYDALSGKIPIIGVAKKPFAGISSKYEMLRGASTKPLFVTSIGIALDDALESLNKMHGEFRIPSLLKLADQVCRGRINC